MQYTRREVLATGTSVAALAATSSLCSAAVNDIPRLIAFGSCARENKPQPIWEHIVALEPDLMIMLGDNIYGDTEDMDVMRAKYAQLAEKPGFKRLRERCPIVATWDDHDYGLNDAGVEFAMKDESQKVFADFFALPADAGPRKRPGVYDSYLFGPIDSPAKRVQVIMLDTRYFRDALEDRTPDDGKTKAPYVGTSDTSKTLLGIDQWAWLKTQLEVPAALRIIGSSIQFASNKHGWEKWGNFPHERQRLIDMITETQANGCVFLSGDRHLAELSMIKRGVDRAPYPLFDVTSSGLNQGGGGNANEPNPHRAAPMHRGANFGTITLNLEGDDPGITLRVHDADGKPVIEQAVALSQLRS